MKMISRDHSEALAFAGALLLTNLLLDILDGLNIIQSLEISIGYAVTTGILILARDFWSFAERYFGAVMYCVISSVFLVFRDNTIEQIQIYGLLLVTLVYLHCKLVKDIKVTQPLANCIATLFIPKYSELSHEVLAGITLAIVLMNYMTMMLEADVKRNKKQITSMVANNKLLKRIIGQCDDALIVLNEFSVVYANGAALKLLNSTSTDDVFSSIRQLEYVERFANRQEKIRLFPDVVGFIKSESVGQRADLGIVDVAGGWYQVQGSRLNFEVTPNCILNFTYMSQIDNIIRTDAHKEFKSLLLKTVWQEISEPTSNILRLSHDIEEQLHGNVEYEDSKRIRLIRSASNMLLCKMSDLSDYAAIYREQFTLHPEQVSIRLLLDELVEQAQLQSERKDLRINLDIESDVPSVLYLDQHRLCQIMSNLLSNSLKNTFEGFIGISISLNEDEIKFQVRDTGVGINAVKLNKIREILASDHSDISDQNQYGMGLQISNLIAQHLGGALKIKSRVNLGTTVSFKIPFVKEHRQPISQSSEQPDVASDPNIDNAVPAHFPRIVGRPQISSRFGDVLVVDDDDFCRLSLVDQLKLLGISADEAENGSRAIQQIMTAQTHQHHYRLIFMDSNMPDISGASLAKSLKHKHVTGEVEYACLMVGVVDLDSLAEEKKFNNIGVVEVIRKPLMFAEIRRITEKYQLTP